MILRVKAHLWPVILDSDGNDIEEKDEIFLNGFLTLHAEESTL